MAADTNNLVKDVRKTPEATTVVLTGEIDLNHSPTLHSALVEVTNERPKKLLLDLREVPYMDSSGVGTFVEVFRRVNAYKGKMIIFGLNDRVRSIFEITKLDRFFKICTSEEEALKA
jgi:anti-sigma B factor antagonist